MELFVGHDSHGFTNKTWLSHQAMGGPFVSRCGSQGKCDKFLHFATLGSIPKFSR